MSLKATTQEEPDIPEDTQAHEEYTAKSSTATLRDLNQPSSGENTADRSTIKVLGTHS
ncbi:hypothetical protein SynSYN20_02678 [Synechococcus sp. SYN20]|nr:hypothetical protein SynSYN20_02678 [Synechococcus sp. SYN20]